MSALARLASMLGLPAAAAEDALHSERAARLVLSRRAALQGMAVGVAALATGKAFGFGELGQHGVFIPEPWIPDQNLLAYARRVREAMAFARELHAFEILSAPIGFTK